MHLEKIRLMWKDPASRTGNCPALYEVNEGPGGYLVVGKVVDADTRAQVAEISGDETAVWVPAAVLDRLRGN